MEQIESRGECPSCHIDFEIRLDDDENEERYCPQCGYWEYVDPELNEYEMDASYLTGE